MAWVEFKLFRDKTQASRVSVCLEAIAAIVEIDAKKTRLMVGEDAITVHGSFAEVTTKVQGAG